MIAIELRKERATLIKQARDIVEAAEKEARDLSAEEQINYDKAMADIDNLRIRIERDEKLAGLEADGQKSIIQPVKELDARGAGNGGDAGKEKEFRKAAFCKFLRSGIPALSGEEKRALQADSNEAGGYTIAPQEFVASLIKAVDDMVYVRQFATVTKLTKSDSLGIPSLDADPADADWTSELAIGSEDTTMDFGKRELNPKPLAKFIKVSNKLLRTSALDIDSLVQQRLAYKFGISEEKGFLTGSGAGQPLGLLTASADGIPASRDVSTGNTTTSVTFDGLIEAKYTLKGNYWAKAKWMFHRDAVKQIAKLKNGEGQYIWESSVIAGQPDRILKIPVLMSEYVSNTFTTGLYVGILGDLSFYWIVDALDMNIQRLVELYAAANQTGFIGRLECDGMPTLAEAFVRVKLA